MRKKILFRVLGLLLAVLAVTSLGSCAASRTVRPSSNADKVVAVAGETEILYDEYYYLVMSRLRELKEAYKEEPLSDEALRAEVDAFLKENLLNQTHALLEIGQKYGIDIESGEIGDNVQAHMDGILANTFEGDRDAYVSSLNEDYLTDRYVRTVVAVENYLSIEIIKAMLESGDMDDTDETALAFLRGESFIRVRQVLIEGLYVGGMDKAKAKAEELRARVAAKTTTEERNSAMLDAMQYSRDFTDVGNGLYFARGEMEEVYEEAAFALADYDVSEVLEVEGGYCFMMRLPKSDEYLIENLETLKGKTYYIVLNRMVQARLGEMKLEMTEFGSSLDPLALDPIDAAGGEGVVLVIIGVVVLVAVLACVFVVRVLLLRRNVKRGKLPMRAGKKRKGK